MRALLLPLILAACSRNAPRVAVRTDCRYEEVAAREYDVVKKYALYYVDGTMDGEWDERSFVGAASREYVCFDDFAVRDGCPESVMKKASGLHGGAAAYCRTRPE
jgi:hypothetical protein